MKVLNTVLILLSSTFAGLLSMALYIGSDEDYNKLIQDLPVSFIERMGASLLVGLLGILFIIFINYLVNLTRLTETNKINLKLLAKNGIIITLIMTFLGTTLFFIS